MDFLDSAFLDLKFLDPTSRWGNLYDSPPIGRILMFRGCLIGQHNPEINKLIRCNSCLLAHRPALPKGIKPLPILRRAHPVKQKHRLARVSSTRPIAPVGDLPAYSYCCTWAERAPPTTELQDASITHRALHKLQPSSPTTAGLRF